MREEAYAPLPADVLVEHKISTPASFPYHRHDGYELLLFLGGVADYYVEQNCYKLKRGNLLVIRPEKIHRLRCYDQESKYERILINIRTPYLKQLSSKKTKLTDCLYRKDRRQEYMAMLTESELQEYIRLSRKLEEVIHSDFYGQDLLKAALTTQIVLLVNRIWDHSRLKPENVMPELVVDTMKYVNEHLTEQIQIEAMAQELYHNRSHISRLFKEHTGISLQQYIITQRLNLVMRQLQEGYSLTQASENAGFNNYSNFIRTFTKYVGITPHRYQLENAKKAEDSV